MAAKKRAKHAIRHGKYAYLALGSLPKGASYIRRLIGQFRGALEQAVRDKEGEITIYSTALVQSACRHEGRAQLMTRWLRLTEPKLTLTDRLAVLREIGAATDARDRCLRTLGLDKRPEADPLTTLYAPGLPASSSPSDEGNAERGAANGKGDDEQDDSTSGSTEE